MDLAEQTRTLFRYICSLPTCPTGFLSVTQESYAGR